MKNIITKHVQYGYHKATWYVTPFYHGLSLNPGMVPISRILPLGADEITATEKSFDNLHMLCFGTFFYQNV